MKHHHLVRIWVVAILIAIITGIFIIALLMRGAPLVTTDKKQSDLAAPAPVAVAEAPPNTKTKNQSAATRNGAAAILVAPQITQAQQPGEIVGLVIQNNSNQAITARTITFGQAFVAGNVPHNSTINAVVQHDTLPIQMDVKTRHADGSAKTAILSMDAPALAAHTALDVMLRRISATTDHAINPQDFVHNGYDLNIILTLHNANDTRAQQTIDVGAALDAELKAGTATTWLHGPLVSEVQIVATINSALRLKLNIRGNTDQSFLTDVQMLNDGIFSTESKNYTYDIEISSHGHSAFRQNNLQHLPLQAWHRLIYSDTQGIMPSPTHFVVYDVRYLIATGFIPAYDTTTGVLAATVTKQLARLDAKNTGLFGAAHVTTYQPTTGGRVDIGQTTAWSANWLVSQDPGAKRIMLANADAAAAAPFHAVNPDGSMVNSIRNPLLWLDYRAKGKGQGAVDVGAVTKQSGWTLDTAHIPDLSYIPALTQGSQFYLEQLQAQANYDVLSINPPYRSSDKGIVVDAMQVRALAWTLRDLANATVLTPDTNPQKAQLTTILHNNIQRILTEYVHGPVGIQEGKLAGYVIGVGGGGARTQVAPWQQGYLAVVLAQTVKQGFTEAAEICAWQNNFLTGLFLNAANGYNPLNGPAYWLTVGTNTPGGYDIKVTDWGQLYSSNFPDTAPTTLAGYPTDAVGGYPAVLKAAFAALWDVTQASADLTAYDYLTKLTPALSKADNQSGYLTAQTWNIRPTLPNEAHEPAVIPPPPITPTDTDADNHDDGALTLTDVQSGDWYAPAVQQLVKRGAISGFADKSFRPNQMINRAELAKILAIAFGKSTATPAAITSQPFSDVSITDWFAPFVSSIKQAGVTGYPNGTFGPSKPVNRAEALAMTLKIAQVDTDAVSTIALPFTDVPYQTWYTKSIAWSYANKIINGKTAQLFAPADTISRAELSKIVVAVLAKSGE